GPGIDLQQRPGPRRPGTIHHRRPGKHPRGRHRLCPGADLGVLSHRGGPYFRPAGYHRPPTGRLTCEADKQRGKCYNGVNERRIETRPGSRKGGRGAVPTWNIFSMIAAIVTKLKMSTPRTSLVLLLLNFATAASSQQPPDYSGQIQPFF